MSRLKPTDSGAESNLDLTSLLDVFTIINLFLLVTVVSATIHVTESSKLRLPRTMAPKQAESGIELVLTTEGLVFDGSKLGPVPLLDSTLNALNEAASVRRSSLREIHGKERASERVVLIVDRELPYRTVERVLSVLEANAFTRVDVIVKRESAPQQ